MHLIKLIERRFPNRKAGPHRYIAAFICQFAFVGHWTDVCAITNNRGRDH